MDKIEIIYEDDDVLVINKPSGILTHPDGNSDEESISDWVVKERPEVSEIGEKQKLNSGETIDRHGIVHRLDRMTSGVLIITKTQESFENLKEQFQNREIKKIYRGFAYGIIQENEGTIDRPIGKSKKDFKLWSAQRGAGGKMREAQTSFKVLKRGSDAVYLEISPKTGRTHQIRVHMKAIHHPIVCDSLYAPKHKCILGLERLALHAYSITFRANDGSMISAQAALPSQFEAAEALL